MAKTVVIFAIFLLASHMSSAVILRPRWFPYFPRYSQGCLLGTSSRCYGFFGLKRKDHNVDHGTFLSDESRSSNGLSALTDGAMSSRHARTVDSPAERLCHEELTDEECLSKLILAISRILQTADRKK